MTELTHTAAAEQAAEDTAMDDRKRWLALIVLCLGDLMIVLDTTIVNVALPSIQDDLGFTRDLAGLGGQRVHAHLRRLPAARRPAGRPVRPPPAVPARASRSSRWPRSPAGSRDSQALLVAARAVQGLGGAVVSAVALSLIMILFTEPADRAKAMGVFGFVLRGRRQRRRAARRRAHRRCSTGTGSSSSTCRSASRSSRSACVLLPPSTGRAASGGSTSRAPSR